MTTVPRNVEYFSVLGLFCTILVIATIKIASESKKICPELKSRYSLSFTSQIACRITKSGAAARIRLTISRFFSKQYAVMDPACTRSGGQPLTVN